MEEVERLSERDLAAYVGMLSETVRELRKTLRNVTGRVIYLEAKCLDPAL